MRNTCASQVRVTGFTRAPVEAMVYSLTIFPDSR